MIRAAILGALLAAGGLAGEPASLPPMAIDGEVLHANTVRVLGLDFRDVTARPRMARGVIEFTDAEAKAYRGRIAGWYAIDLVGRDRLQSCSFKLSGLDLGTMLRSLGATNDQVAGRLDGWFELAIPRGDAAAISGRGEVEIADGSLVQMPLLVSFLAGNPTAARGKDRLTARFEIAERAVRILWLRLESPAIELAAQGTISFDGRLDIEIAPRLPFDLLRSVPLLGGWAASGLSRLATRVGRAYVRGNITQPVVVFGAFGGR